MKASAVKRIVVVMVADFLEGNIFRYYFTVLYLVSDSMTLKAMCLLQ